jgi:hypothetical protein
MTIGSFLPLAVLLGFFVILLAAFIYEWVYRFADRTAQDVIPYLRFVNLEEVASLFHPSTEKYLELNLSLAEFRKTQRKRCRLALQYAGNLAHNARIFQEWGKYERKRSRITRNSEVKRPSLELTIACAQCRICSLVVRLKIHLWLVRMAVLPFSTPPAFASLSRLGSVEMLSFYEKIKSAAQDLGRAYGDTYRDQLAHAS